MHQAVEAITQNNPAEIYRITYIDQRLRGAPAVCYNR